MGYCAAKNFKLQKLIEPLEEESFKRTCFHISDDGAVELDGMIKNIKGFETSGCIPGVEGIFRGVFIWTFKWNVFSSQKYPILFVQIFPVLFNYFGVFLRQGLQTVLHVDKSSAESSENSQIFIFDDGCIIFWNVDEANQWCLIEKLVPNSTENGLSWLLVKSQREPYDYRFSMYVCTFFALTSSSSSLFT